MERLSELTLYSHRAAYEAAKWNRLGKLIKKTRANLLETLVLYGLEEEYYYILGGEKGDPPKVPETVPMEMCSEAGAVASHGGGDTPLSCKHVSWEELPPLESYLHVREIGTQDVHILSKAAIKRLGAWLHWIDMTVRYDEARANSPCDDDHKLGALLDYFLMPENTGVSLEDIIGQVVAENVDALEVHLAKGKKVLKEATKAQLKLLTRVAKQKMAQKKSHSTEAVHKEATKVLRQVTEQLDQVRGTIAHHMVEIARIEALLKDCESTEEESSSRDGGFPSKVRIKGFHRHHQTGS